MGDFMKKNVTILDLAKESGISKSTISRYLRGENVSKEKGLIIEKAIVKTGYIRNNFAQLLRTNKSNFIGVLVPDLDNPFFLTIIKRLDQLAYQDGKTLIIKTTESNHKREQDALSFVRGFNVDGVFLCRSEFTEQDIEELRLNIPIISIDKKFDNISSVVSNNFKNGYILTKHIAENVEGNIMFFSRDKESTSVKERINGYHTFCDETGKSTHYFTYNKEDGLQFEVLRDFIINNNIEAIISRNDNEAIKIQSYLNDLFYTGQLHRIKVAGFDNIRLSKSIIPQLTTIDQNIEKMCDLGYKIINDYDNYKINAYVQDSELIIRKSTT